MRRFIQSGDLFYIASAGSQVLLPSIHKTSVCRNATALLLFLDPSSFSRYHSPLFLVSSPCAYLKAIPSLTFPAAGQGFLHGGHGGATIRSRLELGVLCLPAPGGSLKTKEKRWEGREQGLKNWGDIAERGRAVSFVFYLFKRLRNFLATNRSSFLSVC